MSLYVKLDVEYAHDPKMIDAGPMAELLYVRALCFAKRSMKDGFIAERQLPAIALGIPAPHKHAATLVEVGAWEPTTGGWNIASWLKRNKSAARIAHDIEARRMKSVMGNHERWHVKEGKYDPTCEICNPIGDPYRDPRGDPGEESTEEESEEESETEAKPEAKPEAEAQSSSEMGSTTDDDFRRAVELIVDAKVAAYKPNKPRAYAMTVRSNTIAEDGELIRRMLTDDPPSTPEQAAAFVLGYGFAAERERAVVPWCDASCPTCGGDAWVDVGDGLAPCPNRGAA